MPTPHYERIASFMQKAGQDTPTIPAVPDDATRLLRAKLILEEALETIQGLGVGVQVTGENPTITDAKATPLEFFIHGEADIEEVADGCADISVVTIGTLIAFGIDDEPLLEEVDNANLRKFAPGSYRREDGKWMKPPGWTPPDITGVLARQKKD